MRKQTQKIFAHAHHLARQKATSLLIKTCDTDVLVIVINAFETLQAAGLETMWVEFGLGQSIRWFPIHDLVKNLGPEKPSGMLFFHAFTGCDVVSSFQGKANMGCVP